MKILLAPLAIAVVTLMTSTTRANVETTPTTTHEAAPAVTTSHEETGIQLADEITRRIRRLGVAGIRFPNSRPSEMVGEIC